MTALLASVLSAEEAELAVRGGADIVDLKDPGQGALGALPDAVIRQCLAQVAGRRPVSATLGDLPMTPGVVAGAAARTGALGVDFVKVGIFPGGDLTGCLDALAEQAVRGFRIVAVFFADLEYPAVSPPHPVPLPRGEGTQRHSSPLLGEREGPAAVRRWEGEGVSSGPDSHVIQALAARGFAGVMLDTAGKAGGGLRSHLGEARLRAFVREARDRGLFTGLAGSLGPADVAPLLPLGPDYLGFRGALTSGGRGAPLDPAAVAALRRTIKAYQPSSASSATAAAGAQQAAPSRSVSGPVTSSAKSL